MKSRLVMFYRTVVTFRYLRFALDLIQYYGFFKLTSHVRAHRDAPFIPSHDVTIVSSTLGTEKLYEESLQSWLKCDPKAIVIVSIDTMLKPMKELLERIDSDRITLLTVRKPNFRQQMSKGIKSTSTELIVFADDDSIWSSQTLKYLVAPFSDASVGGVNTMQQVQASNVALTMWESFGALNLVRRNVLHSALAYFNDGQVLNLSGRTVAYRTQILKQEEFLRAYTHDYWRGRYLLRTGDDNFLTSWTVQHGWRTCFQNHHDAMVTTTANANATYLKQVLRWSRDTARCYLRDVGFALRSRRRRDYVRCILNCTANYASDFAILMELGFLLVASGFQAFGTQSPMEDQIIPDLSRLCIHHVIVSGILHIFEHLPFFVTWRSLLYLPGALLYMYIHAIVVCFALLTLHKSVWGSQPGADDISVDEQLD